MRDTEKTFRWITDILNRNRVPFVVTGGLSAKIYGSPRPLNDIDIDIPFADFDAILPEVRPFIVYGPDRFVDERWDLHLITLNHEGQEIDLSGGDTVKICDNRTGIWHDMPTDFDDVERIEVFGVTVPVITRRGLIEYKSMLAGEHQKTDIEAARRSPTVSP